MAVRIENGVIIADAKEELEQSLQERRSEISRRSARRAPEDAFQFQRWDEMVNEALQR